MDACIGSDDINVSPRSCRSIDYANYSSRAGWHILWLQRRAHCVLSTNQHGCEWSTTPRQCRIQNWFLGVLASLATVAASIIFCRLLLRPVPFAQDDMCQCHRLGQNYCKEKTLRNNTEQYTRQTDNVINSLVLGNSSAVQQSSYSLQQNGKNVTKNTRLAKKLLNSA